MTNLSIQRAIRGAINLFNPTHEQLNIAVKKTSGGETVLNDIVLGLNGYPHKFRRRPLKLCRTRQTELRKKLRGRVRRTSFSHKIQELDSAFVLDGVSSPELGLSLVSLSVQLLQPKWVVEFGSAFGLGALSIVNAMSEQNGGIFDGFEFEDWRAELAADGLKHFSGVTNAVHKGKIEEQFPRVKQKRGKVNFAFVDAAHTYEATMGYHELLCNNCSRGAVFVYDDINWSDEMLSFWNDAIAENRVTDAIEIENRYGVVQVR